MDIKALLKSLGAACRPSLAALAHPTGGAPASKRAREESPADDASRAYRLLADRLPSLDEPVTLSEAGVWFTKWPSVRISAGDVLIFPAGPNHDDWMAWLDLTLMYNTQVPFTAVATHVIGLGRDRTQALANAVEQWMVGIAPALLSYIYGVLKFGAETWWCGDPAGIAGWSSICGPCVLRGDADLRDELESVLQQHPPVEPVRGLLAERLDSDAPLHSVSLYRAMTGAAVHADVLIDSRQDPEAGELLSRISWPCKPGPTGFISVRQFLLCVRPH